MSETIKGYKGFNKDMRKDRICRCRKYQGRYIL